MYSKLIIKLEKLHPKIKKTDRFIGIYMYLEHKYLIDRYKRAQL